jgi:SAM-dependent methyltransferase
MKVDSKEVGLETSLIIFKYFFHEKHPHYRYWSESLARDLAHLPEAQENYSNSLISYIPTGTETILDVGSGVGRLVDKLINTGNKVDCVLPSEVLTRHAR